jgi:negative regulator of sigma E activity
MTDKHTSNSLSASSPAAIGHADLHQRDAYREQLSAMMDGTLSADESRFLLRRMQHDAELAGCWERWQLFGDAMRGQTGNALPADFSRRVARAIAADVAAQSSLSEPALVANDVAAVAWRQRLRWGGGAALAASVAIAALISTRSLTLDSTPLQSAGSAMTAARLPATAPTPTVAAASTLPPATTSAVDRTASLAAESLAVESLAIESVPAEIAPNHVPKKMASIALVSMDTAASATIATAAVATASAGSARRNARPSNARSGSRPAAFAATTVRNDAVSMTVDPFGRQPLDLTAKPWPRALLSESAAVGGVTVGYSIGSPGVHPSFQPRVDAPRVDASLSPATSELAPAASQAPAP